MQDSVGSFASTESEIEEIRALLESLGSLAKHTETGQASGLDTLSRGSVESIAEELKGMQQNLQSVRDYVELAQQESRCGTEESRWLVAKARDLEAMLGHLHERSGDCPHTCTLF